MKPINILDARNNLSKLVTAVENGDDVVIARRGQPVARLVAIERPSSTAGSLAERLVRIPPPSARDPQQVDDDIRDARQSWGP